MIHRGFRPTGDTSIKKNVPRLYLMGGVETSKKKIIVKERESYIETQATTDLAVLTKAA